MRVRSSHAYNLPGHVPLRKGESEIGIGELPPAAKKYLDGLIKAGVVEVLSKPAPAADKAPAPAIVPPSPTPAEPVAVDVPRVPAEDDDAKKRPKKKE